MREIALAFESIIYEIERRLHDARVAYFDRLRLCPP